MEDAALVRPVLVVDLDKTLITSDVLYESLWECASKQPAALPSALASLGGGKAQFKEALSKRVTPDPAGLTYNPDVIDYINTHRASGGRTALVTATNQHIAERIADHLGLFDEVHGSDGAQNLKGDAKAAFLVNRYGAGNYDYIGDSRADLPVWRSARRAVTVGLDEARRTQVQSAGADVIHLSPPKGGIKPYIKALRPHQWSKNILVFLPVIAAHEAGVQPWIQAIFAFICFSLIASAVYVLNDLLDLSADRSHPRKRNRPFASGAVPLAHGTVMVPALMLGGLFFCLLVWRLDFFLVMVAYFIATTAYSLVLKRKIVIDICVLAGLYTMRIFAGGAATGISISEWLLAFSIFFFFSLASVKRQGELVDAAQSGRAKAAGRGYESEDLSIVSMMAIGSGYVSVLVMALYLDSPTVRELYAHPDYLWGICAILLYWVSRMVMVAHRGRMDDDPIVFAMRDPVSRICGIFVALTIFVGMI